MLRRYRKKNGLGNLLSDLRASFLNEGQGNGLVPDWEAPLEGGEVPRGSWPDEIQLALPGTEEAYRFRRIARERLFLRMSLGHPDRVRFLEMLAAESRQLNEADRHELQDAVASLALDLDPSRRAKRRR
jgi:hypothetical protein